MDYLALAAIILSGVVFVCQVLLCIFVFVKLRRMHQTVEHLKRSTDNHNTDSPDLEAIARHMSLAPQPGESITVLHRNSHPEIPTHFSNIEENPEQTNPQKDTTRKHSMEHINQGFEDNSD